MTSFLSVTPTSIRLGLFHSLLSFISISAPLILCAYVLWKYGRKYGLRAYLALTIGQMFFLLFLFYAPYALTHAWYAFEPYITMFGAALTYNILYYMDKDKEFKNFSPFYYLYFIGVMFTNPIRIGNFNAISAIQILTINQVPTLVYCLIFSLSFFILNFSLGLVLTYFLDNSVFLLLKEKKIKEIFYNAILISVVYVFIKFPTRIYYQALLVNLGFPIQAPELANPEYPIYTIANKPITFLRKPIFKGPYDLFATLYNSLFIYGIEFADKNVRVQDVDPNRNTYRPYEKFIKAKQEEREKDVEDEEKEEKKEQGKGAIQLRKEAKNRGGGYKEGVWYERHARALQMRFEMYEDAIMENLWIAKRLQFRTPKYLKLNEIAKSYDEFGTIDHETQDLKGNTMNEHWFRYEESVDPILWVRTLASENRGIPHFKAFVNSIISKDTIINLQIKKLIHELEIEYNRINSEKYRLIDLYCNVNGEVLYQFFKEDIQFVIEEKILNRKKIKRNTLTPKELEALHFLSQIIMQNEFVDPLLALDAESPENLDKVRKIILDIEEDVLYDEITFTTKEKKVISYLEELHGDILVQFPRFKLNPSLVIKKNLKTLDNWTNESARLTLWYKYVKFLSKITTQSFLKTIKNGLLIHCLYDAIEEKPEKVKYKEIKFSEEKSRKDFEVEPLDEQIYREKIVPNNEQDIKVSTKGYKINSKKIKK